MERELPPGLEEVEEFLSVLGQCDRELVRQLILERGHGRDDHPVRAMWNLLAVGLYLRNGKFSELLGELRRNSDLAGVLGFEQIGPNRYKIPSDSALSRFHVKVCGEEYSAKVEAVFQATVRLLRDEHPEFGKHSALDASDVRTHARPPRKAMEEQKEGGEVKKVKVEKPSSDPEASWSVKTKKSRDAEGKEHTETKKTFGYKFYAVSDCTLPAVSAVEVETGSTADANMAMPMLERAQANLGEERMETLAMDKGFDSQSNVLGAHERGVAPLVPFRDVPENLERQPREDREAPVVPGGNVTFDRYTGEVFCYESPENTNEQAVRRQMDYAGFEGDRDAHKFRCPLGANAATECNSYGTCCAGRAGTQGRQIRVPMDLDPRRFAPVYPQSKRWKRLYKGRSGVERINSYVKEVLDLEDHCLRGKNAIKLRVLLASITLNVRTLVSLRRQKAKALAA
jgi:hypothetical protein